MVFCINSKPIYYYKIIFFFFLIKIKKSCSNIASNSIDILLETARSLHRIQLLYGDILEVQKSSNLVN